MSEPSTAPRAATPSAAEVYARHKQGGGLWSTYVSNRIASYIVVTAARQRWTPNGLSLANLGLGTATGVSVIALHHHLAVSAIVGFVGWQLAYACDCADGQLARHQNSGSAFGAVVDVLCDYFAQALLSAAVLVVIAPDFGGTALALAGPLVATGLLLSLFDTTVATQVAGIRPTQGKPSLLALIKRSIRDYGLSIAIIAVLIWLNADALLAFVAAQAALNAVAALKRIRDLVLATRLAA